VSDWQAVVARPDELGESPFWHPQERLLYWVDIPARQIRRTDEGGWPVESWAMPSEPGCIAPLAGGGLMVALRDGVYRAGSWGGAIERVVPFGHDTSKLRFNDGKADPAGRFWAGTIYEPRDAREARLFSIDLRPDNGAGGKPIVQLKASEATVANGLAWSPDARTVYWADTTSHTIHAWDWDAQDNAMRNAREFLKFPGKPAGWTPGDPGYGGRPDGAAIDVQGNYWCAMFEGQRLLQFSPAGAILQEVPVPVRCPTMPCFGGDDLQTLYVTSARHGRSGEELRQLPLSGCVIAMRVDVAGLPVNFVRA
jgi:sugar lactone lactonase YvrE